MSDLTHQSAVDQLRVLSSREASARELAELHLEAIAADPGFNAVVTVDPDAVRAEADAADNQRARGGQLPLLGLPVVVKDSLETRGLRTTCGLPELADHIPDRDADAVTLLRRAGAIILGKANVPPNCQDIQTSNTLFGTTPNPHDRLRTAGGSSGGPAAAVAVGHAPLALGSDLAGSARLPGHYCGVYALRPSHGTVPTRGHIPRPPGWATSSDMLTLAPIARTAADLDLALDVLAAPSPRDATAWRLRLPPPRHDKLRHYRIGWWPDDPFCAVDNETRQLLDHVEQLLRRAGARLDATTRPVDLATSNTLFSTLMFATASATAPEDAFAAECAQADELATDDQSSYAALLRGRTSRHRSWLLAHEQRTQLRDVWGTYFETHDVLITPAAPTAAVEDQTGLPPAERHILVDGRRRPYYDQTTWTNLSSHVHLPSVTVPMGRTRDGLPIGVQIIGPHLEDRTVTRVAALLADARGRDR
ncbi:amidase [Streptomyces sp. NPDC056835]|uniref:amidase n=1 Tax=Streptomyces sp. NPDC056835 TaxID=3345956 RepID=UPI0036A325E7